MKTAIKSISFLLSVLMLTGCFLACAQNPGDTETTAQASANATEEPVPVETSKYDIGDHLAPSYDFKNREIVIASRGRQWTADEVSVESENGDTINDAIYKRNMTVENRLGVRINNYLMTPGTDNYEIAELVRKQISAGYNDYSLICASVYASIIATGENLYCNLTSLEDLDLNQPYWSKGFNDAASFSHSQFFCTGAICLSYYRFIFATFFNRNMFSSAGEPMLYETVLNGDWTIEYQYQLAEKFYSDVNGDQKKDADDIYGFVSNDYISVDPYWSALKLPILTKTADDNMFQYSLDMNRTNEAVLAINKLFWSNPGTYVIAHASGDSEQETIAKKFASGTAAMCTLRLIEVEGSYLRDMSDDYGITPMPKLNKEQDDYYSYAHDTMSAYAIPNTNKSDEELKILGIFLEAMGSASYKYLVPEYYEVALKTKYMNDPDSIQMLDKITDNFFIDPGVLYTKKINSVHQEMRTFIGSKVASAIPRLTALQKAHIVDNLVDTLNSELLDVED